MEQTFWIIAALLTALASGVALSHVLEIPGKRDLDTATAIVVQQRLYRGFRVPGAVVEFGALVASVVAAVFAAGETAAMWWTVAAAAAVLGTSIVFFAATDVQNQRITRWEPAALPDDWEETRHRWELSHGIRAVLFLIALGCLAGAMLST
jgi:Domain of unknown function (DUF1772)